MFFFVIHQSFFHSTKLCPVNSKSFRKWIGKWGPAKPAVGRSITHNFYSILFYFLGLTWPVRWLECVVIEMGGAWGEERDHIEERSNCQHPGPQDSGARQRDSWAMGYLTEERPSNSRMKILLLLLPGPMHQVVLSQSCTKNILAIYFEWKFFKDTIQCVLKVKEQLYCVNDAGKLHP